MADAVQETDDDTTQTRTITNDSQPEFSVTSSTVAEHDESSTSNKRSPYVTVHRSYVGDPLRIVRDELSHGCYRPLRSGVRGTH